MTVTWPLEPNEAVAAFPGEAARRYRLLGYDGHEPDGLPSAHLSLPRHQDEWHHSLPSSRLPKKLHSRSQRSQAARSSRHCGKGASHETLRARPHGGWRGKRRHAACGIT